MKNLGILIYPEFSMQEVANLMHLFRWKYDTKSVMIASSKDIVVSEEGILIQPEISIDEFTKKNYHALILPGMSDFRPAISDDKLLNFLSGFKGDDDFTIAAICGGPLLLSLSGLLDDKKFTNSLYLDMNENFKCIDEKNLVYAPLVEDGNIITAVGNATRIFAIALARNVGLDCSDKALSEVDFDNYKKKDFIHRLDEDGLKIMNKAFKELL